MLLKTRNKARKSEKMSDTLKKAAAILMIAFSASAVIVSAFRIQTADPVSYTGSGIMGGPLSSTEKISPGDVFNAGSIYDLCKIQGIGEVLAERIITEREENGFFIYPEDILSVNGIGDKKLEQYRPLMRMNSQESGE